MSVFCTPLMDEPSRCCLGEQTCVGPSSHVLDGNAHWRHLANMIEWSMCNDDAALCQSTLTACYYGIWRHSSMRSFIYTHTPGWAGTRKVKTNLDFTEARDNEWQWHQLGHMQVCTSPDNDASTPPLSFLWAGYPSQLPNQQHQSTEGTRSFI